MQTPDPKNDITVPWSSSLSVNSPTLDMHHQILIGCLNRLYILRENWKQALPAVGKELRTLINYCRIHFFVEEKAMELAKVPGADREQHQKVHRSIVKKMNNLWAEFEKNPKTFSFDEALKFFYAWLVKHVQEEDKATYAQNLRTNRTTEQEIRKIRYADVARKLEMQSKADEEISLSGKRILMADRNLDRRTQMMRALQEQGASVTQTTSIGEARGTIEALAPDAVIFDWSLDEAKDFAYSMYLTRDTPCIASWFGEFKDILDDAEIVGVDNILLHPASAKETVRVVKTTLVGLVPLRAHVNQQEEDRLAAA